MKPIIAISAARWQEREADGYRAGTPYVHAVLAAGALPVLLPAAVQQADLYPLLAGVAGVLLPGGINIAPQRYGQEPLAGVTSNNHPLDVFEFALVETAVELGLPVLGICRGHQLLNVMYGGSLFQELTAQCPKAHGHLQTTPDHGQRFHTVNVEPDSFVARAMGVTSVGVNSFHHQAVDRLASGFRVTARARDGVVEAIENETHSLYGIQWHPEWQAPSCPEMQNIFNSFVELCSKKQNELLQKAPKD